MKHTEKAMGLGEQYSYLLRNKYWLLFQGGGLCNGMSLGFLIGSMGYWIQHVLGPSGMAGDNPIGLIMTVMNVPMMVAPFLILPFIKFVDAKNIVVMFMGLGAVFSLGMWACGLKIWWLFVVLMILRQCVGSCVNGSANVLLTRAIDYGEWKFGVRQEGVGSSFSSALNKGLHGRCHCCPRLRSGQLRLLRRRHRGREHPGRSELPVHGPARHCYGGRHCVLRPEPGQQEVDPDPCRAG